MGQFTIVMTQEIFLHSSAHSSRSICQKTIVEDIFFWRYVFDLVWCCYSWGIMIKPLCISYWAYHTCNTIINVYYKIIHQMLTAHKKCFSFSKTRTTSYKSNACIDRGLIKWHLAKSYNLKYPKVSQFKHRQK